MKYQFYTCDVFTETRFGGNPLAVFPHASGLTTHQMQQIAREFNYSESSFVLPPEVGYDRRVRIFAPTMELPFAGHPNIGTAFVLASIGEFGEILSSIKVTFEERAGLVPIEIEAKHGRITKTQLAAPELLTIGQQLPVSLMASAVSLDQSDIQISTHYPRIASTGLPFNMVELTDRNALERANPNPSAFNELVKIGLRPSCYLYTRSDDDFDIRARMFAQHNSIIEDPATGSASCVVAGLLAHFDDRENGRFDFQIAQGVEMGRPSIIQAYADKKNGEVISTGVGGPSVLISQGFIELD